MIRELLDSCHVPIQGFRRCNGILRLGRRYGDDVLEECCARALAQNRGNYTFIRDTISAVAEDLEEQKQEAASEDNAVQTSSGTSVDALLARTAAIIEKGGETE